MPVHLPPAVPSVTFRPLTRADLARLHAWLARPHVSAWWGAPPSLAQVEADYGPMTDPGGRVLGFIARTDETEIGFVQCYEVKDAGDGWWEDETDPGARGIDLFLCDAERMGRGLGVAMMRAFVARLFDDPAVTTVQTDPSPDNTRAIRSYARAGFKTVGPIITPDGPAVLMRCDRPHEAPAI